MLLKGAMQAAKKENQSIVQPIWDAYNHNNYLHSKTSPRVQQWNSYLGNLVLSGYPSKHINIGHIIIFIDLLIVIFMYLFDI